MALKVPAHWERFRLRDGPDLLMSDPGDNYGMFVLTYHGAPLQVMVSDGDGWSFEGEPWEHASVSHRKRCPTWDEMHYVRESLWEPEDTVLQIHAPASRYVNFHPFCLHLWRPTRTTIPLPPRETMAP